MEAVEACMEVSTASIEASAASINDTSASMEAVEASMQVVGSFQGEFLDIFTGSFHGSGGSFHDTCVLVGFHVLPCKLP